MAKPKNNPGAGQNAPALGMQHRAASVSSVDIEARTVDLVWSTGARVRRWSWFREEYYDEELTLTEDACDLSRLNGGAPVLNTHSQWDLRSVLGVVQRAWIEGGEGRATVRFAKPGDSEEADRVFRMVQDGILRNVSVGYTIRKMERERREGEVAIYRATDWQPSEISIVAVGADAKAGIRAGESAETYPLTLTERALPTTKETTMDPEDAAVNGQTETRTTPAPAARTAPEPVEGTRAAPASAEHAWSVGDISRLQSRAAAFGLSAEDAITVMGSARSIDAATDALQTLAAARNAPRQRPQAQVITDEGDTLRAAVETSILHRANSTATTLTDAARQYRGMSLLEVGRAFVEESGGGRIRNLGKHELAGQLLGLSGTRAGMQSTSDFANILANVASKRMRNGYGTARQTWKPFSRQNNAPDFKERQIAMLTGLPELKRVREGQEYSYAKFGDTVEKYAIGTFGRLVSITRQTLINDDLGAFDRLPMMFGRAAAEFESDTVWAILTGSHVMGDGVELFHADHGNLAGAGAALSESTLEAAEIAMGAQKDAAGKPINLQPRFLAVSRKHRVAAAKLLASVISGKTADVNVYANSMDLIVEDRLFVTGGSSPWLMIGDPAQWDTLEYAYLEGEEGLYTEQRVGFEVDGIEIKGRLDFGAKAIDHKGFYKNPGS